MKMGELPLNPPSLISSIKMMIPSIGEPVQLISPSKAILDEWANM